MEADAGVVTRLRAAGCVWAEDEAALLALAARSPAELDAMVERRAGGEPLEQVIGWAEFCGLRIIVDPGVFVPRRRSEFLVSVALDLALGGGRSAGHGGPAGREGQAGDVPVIVDLCCGTGALGLAVAAGIGEADGISGVDGSGAADGPGEADGPGGADGVGGAGGADGAPWPGGPFVQDAALEPFRLPDIELHGVELHGVELHGADLDPAAVACARRNVEPAGGRVYAGDLFGALPDSLRGRIDVLICNAPYVPTSEIAFMPAEAREHEALMALDGGADGLAVLRRAADGGARWLAPGGVLLVETSERQAASMAASMSAAGLMPQIHEDPDSGATTIAAVRPARA
jgi:release factor glutamine methyltransferase